MVIMNDEMVYDWIRVMLVMSYVYGYVWCL